jgi:hypothetical protein
MAFTVAEKVPIADGVLNLAYGAPLGTHRRGPCDGRARYPRGT